MIKRFIRILYLALITATATISLSLVALVLASANSYVAEVNLKKYNKKQVTQLLEFLNKHAGVEVFKKKGYRKITITEVTAEEMSEIIEAKKGHYVLGVAEPRLKTCEVHVIADLPPSDFSDVLLHELVHCFGFNHVEDSTDLMAAYDEGTITQASRIAWAKRLGRIVKLLRF